MDEIEFEKNSTRTHSHLSPIEQFVNSRFWTDPIEALEWIKEHADEIHQKALRSCVDYPPDIELQIFDIGYQVLIDGEEMTK
jgi:hypothetical protein